MLNPLEVTFHDIHNHPKINEIIREKFEKVQTIAPDVTKVHVVIEKLSKHHQKANTACVRIDIKVPHLDDIFISEKCSEDEADLCKNVIKAFKRGKQLLREEIRRRRHRSRVPSSPEALLPDEKTEDTLVE
ncbi:MAG: HPF/RaiA family ribosome-associated protein [Candidatus Omnitrophica bacterium]|nr:HPF/RaiA family ribosome-associated protein [Candidatus Omnitrophota bacterium]